MKMFVPLLSLLSLACAEPPVGDGYAASRSSHDHHEHPGSSSSSHDLSTNYGPPSTKTLSQEFGPPGQGSETTGYSKISTHGTPDVRSELSQEYGVPDQRSSDSYLKSPSTQYGAPELKSKTATYLQAQRTSDSYTPSQIYGSPEEETAYQPHGSEDYSAKSVDVSSYNAKVASSMVSKIYGAPKKAPAQTYGVPSSRSISMSYGAPSARNSDSYLQHDKTVSQTYGAPSKKISESYGAPDAKTVSMEYGAPELKTNAIASAPYPAARSSPSESYGAPSARNSSPSEQYGVPEHEREHQGYEDSRNAANFEDEEPVNYEFAYAINDAESGSEFGHKETRNENRAEGSYFVVLPDGTKQVVEYEADERGFKPRIFLEAAEARNAEGPY